MRQAKIFHKEQLAGILTENDAGYEFRYLPEYLSLETAKPVSLTLPLRKEAYVSGVLFPFFDGLIPIAEYRHQRPRPYVFVVGLLQRLCRGGECCCGKWRKPWLTVYIAIARF